MSPRVVVVGAGIKGLYAARLLAAQGVEVVVVERELRAGGKIVTARGEGGALAELGAMRLNDDQHTVLELVRELGLTTRPFVETNDARGFSIKGFAGTNLAQHGVGVLVKAGLITEAELADAGVEPSASFGHVLSQLAIDPPAEFLTRPTAEFLRSQDQPRAALRRLALLILDMRNGHGGMHNIAYLCEILNVIKLVTGQPLEIEGGFDQLVSLMASNLDVRLGWGVSRIVQCQQGAVTVECVLNGSSGLRTLQADAVLVACPALHKIVNVPPLPAALAAGVERLRVGCQPAAKMVLLFRERFWEREGQGGVGGVSWVYPSLENQIYYPGPGEGAGFLMLYVRAQPMVTWLQRTREEREESALQQIQSLHSGVDVRSLYVRSQEAVFDEEGCAAYFLNGGDELAEVLEQPHGKVWFTAPPRGWIDVAINDAKKQVTRLLASIGAAAPGAGPASPFAPGARALGVREIAAAVASGELAPATLVRSLLQKASDESHLNAFIALSKGDAVAAASRLRVPAASSPPLPLLGVPIGVKDNINVAGFPCTAGTKALAGFHPRSSAPVVQKLVDAGAIVLGKTNLHELSFGITSNNAAYGAVLNPHDRKRFAGGSSGGSAAAVAAGLVPAALGTDTGGSARIPAALCGCVGFRPSTGRYPMGGIVPISRTQDTPGVMARTVRDVALLDAVLTDRPTTQELPTVSLAGVRLGLPKPFVEDLDNAVAEVFESAKAKLQAAGAVLVPVDLSAVANLANEAEPSIVLWEASRALGDFLQEHEVGVTVHELTAGIESPDVAAVMKGPVLGRGISDVQYGLAISELRPRLQLAYAAAFRDAQLAALLFPCTPLAAQPIVGSDETVLLNGRQVPTFPTFVRNTRPAATAGLPAISLRGGLSRTEPALPVGLELDGPALSDERLLQLALAVERQLAT